MTRSYSFRSGKVAVGATTATGAKAKKNDVMVFYRQYFDLFETDQTSTWQRRTPDNKNKCRSNSLIKQDHFVQKRNVISFVFESAFY